MINVGEKWELDSTDGWVSTGKMEYKDMTVGVGYPISFGTYTLRGEMRVTTPNWTEFKEWEYSPTLSLQFSFDALKPKE